MKVASITEFIRNSKKIIEWINNKETVIIHRQRGEDLVVISLEEWNRLNNSNNLAISPTYNKPYNKETQQAIKDVLSGKTESIDDVDDFFENL